MDTKPWLTAINRTSISAPLKKLINDNEINNKDFILDYGCGHGFDLQFLKKQGYKATGYDKYIEKYSDSNYNNNLYDKIICFYVLNTIEDIEERKSVIYNLTSLLKEDGCMYIAVRSIYELNSYKNKKYTLHKDGLVTSKNTFQKYFSKEEIESLVNQTINLDITYIKFDKKTLLLKIKKERI